MNYIGVSVTLYQRDGQVLKKPEERVSEITKLGVPQVVRLGNGPDGLPVKAQVLLRKDGVFDWHVTGVAEVHDNEVVTDDRYGTGCPYLLVDVSGRVRASFLHQERRG